MPAAETARLAYKVDAHSINDPTEQSAIHTMTQLSLGVKPADALELSRTIGSTMYAIAEKCRVRHQITVIIRCSANAKF